jgi:hypothetical protein
MHLDHIFCLANVAVRLQFLAMERSLRATGCRVPIRVIPYDDNLFELPPNASWHVNAGVFGWLKEYGCHPTMRKYVCLLESNYHFLDADIIILRNPEDVVSSLSGLIASCTEWAKPQWTYTASSAAFFASRTSTWMREVFSTGQFAIDRQLYSPETLHRTATSPAFAEACIRYPLHEQPGINQLVLATDIARQNLTLPPHEMQSTWAGDYPGEYEHLWADPTKKPYLIHWAGPETLDIDRPINRLFYEYLTNAEMREWQEISKRRVAEAALRRKRASSLVWRAARLLKRTWSGHALGRSFARGRDR